VTSPVAIEREPSLSLSRLIVHAFFVPSGRCFGTRNNPSPRVPAGAPSYVCFIPGSSVAHGFHAAQLWKSFTWLKTAGAGAAMVAVRATRNSDGCIATTAPSPMTITARAMRLFVSIAGCQRPPAMAPTISSGSAPVAIACGNGASGASWDTSSSQAKILRNARRCWVA